MNSISTNVTCDNNECLWNHNGSCFRSCFHIKVEKIEKSYWFGAGSYIETIYTCEGFENKNKKEE